MKLSVKDVANLLGISDKTVYRWIADKKIPFYRINDQYRFSRVELIEWVTANRVSVSADIFLEPKYEGLSLPTLGQALREGGIIYGVEGRDGNGVLRFVVRSMRLPEGVDRDYLFEVLKAREALCSTGIGDGIAIPHPRNPVIFNVYSSSVTLCFLENPVEFGALDGKPVFAMFVILSHSTRAHIHLLSRISFALRDPGFHSVISNRGSQDAIMAELSRVEANLRQT